MTDRSELRAQVWMSICNELSRLSTCQFTQVGALIIHPETKSIVSEGYNGTRPGIVHCTDLEFQSRDDHHHFASANETHAEINAITKAHSLGKNLTGTHIFTTISPCKNCADKILAAGITDVYYQDAYWRDPTLHHQSILRYHHVPLS
jgi:dCMP deaminase